MNAELVNTAPSLGTPYGAFSGSMSAALVSVGDQLGLFEALAFVGATTGPAFAVRTGFDEQSLSEWLSAMVGMGRLEYDARTRCFSYPGLDSPA